jgi:hypothetical protein
MVTSASAAFAREDAPAQPKALREYDEYVAHTGLTDPAATLAQARRDLETVRAQRAAAGKDEAVVADLDVRVSDQQEAVFSLESQVLTYERLRAAAGRAVHEAEGKQSLTSVRAPKGSSHRSPVNVAGLVLVAAAAVAVLAFILTPLPAWRRRRWS